MEPRIRDYEKIAPEAYKAMLDLERYIHESRLERGLIELVKMRASQINGCAFCLNLHSRAAIANGEQAARLFQLDA